MFVVAVTVGRECWMPLRVGDHNYWLIDPHWSGDQTGWALHGIPTASWVRCQFGRCHPSLPLQELPPSTVNKSAQGRPLIPADKAVLDRLEPYLTTKQCSHRTFTDKEKSCYPRNDIATYWQCENYPKVMLTAASQFVPPHPLPPPTSSPHPPTGLWPLMPA